MTQFFTHDGENEQGPFDLERLKSQSLKKDTPIWYEGLENWTTAGEVEELKELFLAKPSPPPLRKNIEEAIPTVPKIETTAYSVPLASEFEHPKKKSITTPLFVAGILAVVGIVGWLIYENKTQADTLNQVQEKVTQQDQQLTQQQQKEQQQLLEEQQEQEEKDRVNTALTEKYMGYRNNWRNYITATSNRYTYSEIGGISDLAVIVYNQTDKIVDEVQVRVDYIKANGGTYKSETISVTNIGANSPKSVYAPTSERGTSVRMEIESITAKAFHFCYPYGMGSNQNFDPYFCK